MTPSSLHRVARWLLLTSAAMVGCSLLRTALGIGGSALAETIYTVGIVCALIAWCLRALLPDPARAGLLCGVAASLFWIAGTTATVIEGNGPALSLPDVLMFGVNVLLCLGVVLYGLSTVPRPIAPSRLLDALLSALTVAAVGASFVFENALAAAHGETATATVYPTAAVGLMALAIGLLALRGWSFDRRFALLAGGIAVLAVTEVTYRWAQAHEGIPPFGTVYDVGWMIGGLLIAGAAWSAQRPLPSEPRRAEIVVPVGLGAISLAVLIAEGTQRDSSALALTLSGLAVATLLGRMALSLALNYRLLLHSRAEALTDAITGLGNNRRLVADLERLGGAQVTLVLLDLNGFKAYNDRFGHVEGDRFLQQVGHSVSAAAGPGARTYRMGGDEFCVLLPAHSAVDPSAIATGAALAGEGFAVTAAFGAVTLPDEATGALAALRLADERMYAHKRERATPLGER